MRKSYSNRVWQRLMQRPFTVAPGAPATTASLLFPARRVGVLSAIGRVSLMAGAGAACALAFAPWQYSVLAILALALLFRDWRQHTPLQAAWSGGWFGLALFGVGASWIYISVHDYGGASLWAAGLLTAAFVLVLATFIAACGALSAWVYRRAGYGLWIMPSLWVLIEYLRGCVVLNGFPWLQIAYSQETTPLAGFLPLVGVYGVGWLCAAIAWGVSGFAFNRQGWKTLTMIVLLLTLGGVLRPIAWTYSVGEPFAVALVQGNIDQRKKWLPEYRDATLTFYREATAAHWGVPLIVWPETAVPLFMDQVAENYLKPLHQAAVAHGSDVVIPLPVRADDGTHYYNAVITLGQEPGVYRKIHLVPFGEYLPLQPLTGFMLNILDIPLGDFTPGALEQTLLRGAGYPFGTSICYEGAFGREILRGMPEAAFLVNVTNDAWFGTAIQPHQHLQMARVRALETGRYLLRATNTGITAIVAPDGRTIAQAPQNVPYVLRGHITPMTGTTPYARWGDTPILLLCAFALLTALSWRRRPKPFERR